MKVNGDYVKQNTSVKNDLNFSLLLTNTKTSDDLI